MAGSLEFIKSVTPSNDVTTFTVQDCFSDKYDVYQILISKTDSNLDNLFLKLNFLDTSDTVIVDSTYDTASLRLLASGSFLQDRFTSQTGFRNVAQFDGTDSNSAGINIMVYNPNDSSSYTFITAQTTASIPAAALMAGTKYIGVLKNTETVTGLRLGYTDSDGNLSANGINDCIVKVFGVK
tara:strand:+ start:165 stop:710 length:546 start_codon:yes stop_codon:yes gene_type:complete